MTSYAADLNETRPVRISGVKGAKSRPFSKTFRSYAAYCRWSETDAAGDFEVHIVENS